MKSHKSNTYNWNRLWLPSDETDASPPLTASGYLQKTSSALSLESLNQRPCLILLGEPGMGKSSEWKKARSLHHNDPTYIFLNLGAFDSEAILREVIRDHPQVAAWRAAASGELHLWLDSFDEGLLHISKLGNAIIRLIEHWPISRLHLRIASRIATWSDTLTTELRACFDPEGHNGSSNVTVLQLLPLTQQQVEAAAEATPNVDTQGFMEAVKAARAVPLAIRPITLLLLLHLYQNGRLQGGAALRGAAIYEQGCLYLCEQWDELRTRSSDLDPARRLLIAGHVAYIGVLTNRRFIAFPQLTGLPLESEVPLEELTDRVTRSARRAEVTLTAAELNDVLRHTGLFITTARGAQWAHQSYAEFLAAWYLHQSGLPHGQWQELFFSPVPDVGVIPPLRETAIWLAALNAEFASILVRRDPVTALRADLLTATDAIRSQLVSQLLHMAAIRRRFQWGRNPYLGRLCHPALAAQLAPVLAAEEPWPARHLAFAIVEACAVEQVVPQLIQQALDPQMPLQVRVESLKSLQLFASDEVATQLRPLAHAIPTEDRNDEFRGNLLRLLWPNQLSPRELTYLLTPRQNTSLTGAYVAFIEYDQSNGMSAGIRAEHLPTLLAWVMRQVRRPSHRSQSTIAKATRAILSTAWRYTGDPKAVHWLAAATKVFFSEHSEVFLPVEAAPRRHLVSEMANGRRVRLPHYFSLTHPQPAIEPGYHSWSKPTKYQALIDQADWEWLLGLLKGTRSPDAAKVLFQAACQLVYTSLQTATARTVARIEELYPVYQQLEPIMLPLERWAWDLNLEEVDAIRKNKKRERKHERKHARKKRKNRHIAHFFRRNRIRRAIKLTFEPRPHFLARWRFLLHEYLINGNAYKLTTQQLMGQASWFRFSGRLRQQVIHLAQRVVREHPPAVDLVYDPNRHYTYSPAWLQALGTCWAYSPEILRAMTQLEWRAWVRLLVFDGRLYPAVRTTLLQAAWQMQPDLVVTFLIAHFDECQIAPTADQEHYTVTQLLEAVPDARLEAAIISRLDAGKWQRSFAVLILKHLLASNSTHAEQWVRDLVDSAASSQTHILTVDVVRLYFLTEKTAALWWTTWERLAVLDAELLRHVIISSDDSHFSWKVLIPPFLSDIQLSQMLRWLVEVLGIVEEGKEADWQESTAESRLRAFRNAIVKQLVERPAQESWNTLLALALDLNYPYWLAFHLAEARDGYARSHWQPWNPQDLQQLLHDPNQQLLQTEQELLSALLRAFASIQRRMKGENPASARLWYPDTTKRRGRTVTGVGVRSENETSDYLRELLEAELRCQQVFIKREVELRASTPVTTGQRVDLYVDAYRLDRSGQRNAFDVLKAIIEVKHSDNVEVNTAIEHQLGRYLREHAARCGLFVVTWIGPRHKGDTIEALTVQLEAQAKAASSDGLLIGSYVLDIRLPGK